MNRRRLLTAGVVLLGVGMIGLSALPGPAPGAAWVTAVLTSLGSAVVLFGPFYLLTRSLDSHIEDVRTETAASVADVRSEAAASVGELANRVNEYQVEVERRLTGLAANVDLRLGMENAADDAAYESLRTAPTREALAQALARADDQGLTSHKYPPRVEVSPSRSLYVSVQYAEGEVWNNSDQDITFRVEDISGRVTEWLPWDEATGIEDFMVKLARVVQRETGEKLDVQCFYVGLADLLQAANSHPDRRPAIELCPPQWMVTTNGVITYGGQRAYPVSHQRLRSQMIAAHVASKPWADADSFDQAHMAALALFPPDDVPF